MMTIDVMNKLKSMGGWDGHRLSRRTLTTNDVTSNDIKDDNNK